MHTYHYINVLCPNASWGVVNQIFATTLINNVILQGLSCFVPFILFLLNQQGEDLNDSQGKYAWLGESDDFICVFVELITHLLIPWAAELTKWDLHSSFVKLTLKLVSISFNSSSVTHAPDLFLYSKSHKYCLRVKPSLKSSSNNWEFYTHSFSFMCAVIRGEHFLCVYYVTSCCFTNAQNNYFLLLTPSTHQTVKASKWVCGVSVSECCGAGASIYG